MAANSPNASTMKLALVVLVCCMAILAPSAKAQTGAAAAAPGTSVPPDGFSFSGCAPFILEATMCVVGVIEVPVSTHPSCCKAISKLNDCSPAIYQRIPARDMDIIKKICAL